MKQSIEIIFSQDANLYFNRYRANNALEGEIENRHLRRASENDSSAGEIVDRADGSLLAACSLSWYLGWSWHV